MFIQTTHCNREWYSVTQVGVGGEGGGVAMGNVGIDALYKVALLYD